MLDMDSSVLTEMQLTDTFASLYNSLPSKTAEIDDTDDCRENIKSQQSPPQTSRLANQFNSELGEADPQEKRQVVFAAKPIANQNNTTNVQNVKKNNQGAEQDHTVEKRGAAVESGSQPQLVAEVSPVRSPEPSKEEDYPAVKDDLEY